MKRDLSLTAPTAILAAALRKRPGSRPRRVSKLVEGGGGIKKSKNNFVAIATLSGGKNTGNRSGAGAKAGNRNAVRTGEHTATARQDKARWRRLMARLDLALEAVVTTHRSGSDPSSALRRVTALVREACSQ